MNKLHWLPAEELDSYHLLIRAIKNAYDVGGYRSLIYVLDRKSKYVYKDYESGVRVPSYNKAVTLIKLWAKKVINPAIIEANKELIEAQLFPALSDIQPTQYYLLTESIDCRPFNIIIKELLKKLKLKLKLKTKQPKAIISKAIGISGRTLLFWEMGRMCPKYTEGRAVIKQIKNIIDNIEK